MRTAPRRANFESARCAIAFIALATAIVFTGACGGDDDSRGEATASPAAGVNTPVSQPSSIATDLPSTPETVSTTSATTPSGSTADGELGALQAGVAAEFDGIGLDADCSPEESGLCADFDRVSTEALASGLACLGVGESGGGFLACFGRQEDGAWKFMLGTQNSGGPLLTLPGDMLVCADGEGLNLRSEPSTDASSVAVLPDGAIVTGDRYVLTEPLPLGTHDAGQFAHGWYHILSPQEGWAYDRFLIESLPDGATCDQNWWTG